MRNGRISVVRSTIHRLRFDILVRCPTTYVQTYNLEMWQFSLFSEQAGDKSKNQASWLNWPPQKTRDQDTPLIHLTKKSKKNPTRRLSLGKVLYLCEGFLGKYLEQLARPIGPGARPSNDHD